MKNRTIPAFLLLASLSFASACPVVPGKLANGTLAVPGGPVSICGETFAKWKSGVLGTAQREKPSHNFQRAELVLTTQVGTAEDFVDLLVTRIEKLGYRVVNESISADNTVAVWQLVSGKRVMLLNVIVLTGGHMYIGTITNF